MHYILDIIIAIIILAFVFGAIHKGGVRSLLGLIGGILVVWGASSFSVPLAEGAYHTFVEPGLEKQVTEVLQASAGQSLSSAVEQLTEKLPSYISGPLSAGGFHAESFQEGTEWAAAQASDTVMSAISPILINFLGVIMFLILLLLLFLVLGILMRVLKPILRLPVLRQMDMVLGLFIGIAQCALFFLVTMAVLHWYLSTAMSPPALLSPETIRQTFLFHWIYDWNPISFFFFAGTGI